MSKNKKEVSTEPKVATTQPPEQKTYTVTLVGGFKLDIQSHSEDFAKGLAVGRLQAKIPEFIISQVQAEEKKQ